MSLDVMCLPQYEKDECAIRECVGSRQLNVGCKVC
jgi:hypothetical protein